MADDLSWLYSPQMFRTPERLGRSAWIEHTPFAMWLVDKMRPRTVVELGTHMGVSFAAICQAVKATGSSTKCYAIDTWQGDEHAGFYGDDIYNELSNYVVQRYDFAELIRSTFDEAVGRFEDGSIDLLHIDGLHTYEAVRHDHETWLPKMAPGGVIMFHDTAVKERGFGVYKYWTEIAAPGQHFEFHHGFGLGVLGVDRIPRPLEHTLFSANPTQRTQTEIRRTFSHLGQAVNNRYQVLLAHNARAKPVKSDVVTGG